MKTFDQTITPQTYLSGVPGKSWSIIHQGMPICADKESAWDALAAADHFNLTVYPGAYWNGSTGLWTENKYVI